jgi:hypothetical protein
VFANCGIPVTNEPLVASHRSSERVVRHTDAVLSPIAPVMPFYTRYMVNLSDITPTTLSNSSLSI